MVPAPTKPTLTVCSMDNSSRGAEGGAYGLLSEVSNKRRADKPGNVPLCSEVAWRGTVNHG